MRHERTRRRFLTTLSAGGVLSGIPIGSAVSSPIRLQDDEDTADDPHVTRVVAGPDGAWQFEPSEVTIGLGEAVEWYFDSPGHNVTSHPDASDKNRNPPNADPFTSYEGDDHFAVNEVESTFRHVFTAPGEYEYVCTPHQNSMVGTVQVEACPNAEITVAPGGDPVFEPSDLEIGLGDTVAWHFEESGHNVTAHPDASDRTSLPDDANPFASYEFAEIDEGTDADEIDHEAVRDTNETFVHTVTDPGTYEYVCTIHEDEGMVGTIDVRDEPDAEVLVAPDGDRSFEPESLSIDVGDVVRWSFEEDGHNVTAHPDASDRTSVPDGAEPFASALETGVTDSGSGDTQGDTNDTDPDHDAVRSAGETFDHRFVAVGEFEYVCTIHEDEGMVGTIDVHACEGDN